MSVLFDLFKGISGIIQKNIVRKELRETAEDFIGKMQIVIYPNGLLDTVSLFSYMHDVTNSYGVKDPKKLFFQIIESYSSIINFDIFFFQYYKMIFTSGVTLENLSKVNLNNFKIYPDMFTNPLSNASKYVKDGKEETFKLQIFDSRKKYILLNKINEKEKVKGVYKNILNLILSNFDLYFRKFLEKHFDNLNMSMKKNTYIKSIFSKDQLLEVFNEIEKELVYYSSNDKKEKYDNKIIDMILGGKEKEIYLSNFFRDFSFYNEKVAEFYLEEEYKNGTDKNINIKKSKFREEILLGSKFILEYGDNEMIIKLIEDGEKYKFEVVSRDNFDIGLFGYIKITSFSSQNLTIKYDKNLEDILFKELNEMKDSIDKNKKLPRSYLYENVKSTLLDFYREEEISEYVLYSIEKDKINEVHYYNISKNVKEINVDRTINNTTYTSLEESTHNKNNLFTVKLMSVIDVPSEIIDNYYLEVLDKNEMIGYSIYKGIKLNHGYYRNILNPNKEEMIKLKSTKDYYLKYFIEVLVNKIDGSYVELISFLGDVFPVIKNSPFYTLFFGGIKGTNLYNMFSLNDNRVIDKDSISFTLSDDTSKMKKVTLDKNIINVDVIKDSNLHIEAKVNEVLEYTKITVSKSNEHLNNSDVLLNKNIKSITFKFNFNIDNVENENDNKNYKIEVIERNKIKIERSNIADFSKLDISFNHIDGKKNREVKFRILVDFMDSKIINVPFETESIKLFVDENVILDNMDIQNQLSELAFYIRENPQIGILSKDLKKQFLSSHKLMLKFIKWLNMYEVISKEEIKKVKSEKLPPELSNLKKKFNSVKEDAEIVSADDLVNGNTKADMEMEKLKGNSMIVKAYKYILSYALSGAWTRALLSELDMLNLNMNIFNLELNLSAAISSENHINVDIKKILNFFKKYLKEENSGIINTSSLSTIFETYSTQTLNVVDISSNVEAFENLAELFSGMSGGNIYKIEYSI